jgi:predicted NAD-dependent protein-ADP-ribosyltransferase YbiA (DUF1768 family)
MELKRAVGGGSRFYAADLTKLQELRKAKVQAFLVFISQNRISAELHPVSRAIADQFELKANELLRSDIQIDMDLSEMKQLADLRSWLFKPGGEISVEEMNSAGEALWKAGLSLTEIKSLLQKSGGRNPSSRGLALGAADLRVSRKLPWKLVADQVCDCGSTDHSQKCTNRVKTAVQELRGFLKTQNISIKGL